MLKMKTSVKIVVKNVIKHFLLKNLNIIIIQY